MSKLIFLVLSIVTASFSSVSAFTEQEKAAILEGVKPIVLQCAQSHGIPYEDIKAAQETHSEENLDTRFLGCVFRSCGFLDDNCVYKTNNALDILERYLSNEDFCAYQAKARNCGYLNDEQYNCSGPDCCEKGLPLLYCYRANEIEVILSEAALDCGKAHSNKP